MTQKKRNSINKKSKLPYHQVDSKIKTGVKTLCKNKIRSSRQEADYALGKLGKNPGQSADKRQVALSGIIALKLTGTT